MKFSIRHSKQLFLSAVMATLSQTAISGSLPTNAKLEYALTSASQPLGVVVRTLQKNGDTYTASSKAEPNLFAKFFMKGDITESCEFSMIDNRYRPISYNTTRTEYKPYDRQALFNVEAREVTYKDGRKESFDGLLWDQGCFAYGLLSTDIKAAKSQTIYLNDGDKSRVFILTEAENENVSVPAGDYQTLRIRLERQDKKNQHTMIWLDTKTGIPVKSTNAREGKPSITIELSAIQ